MISAPAATGPHLRSCVMISNAAALNILGWPVSWLTSIQRFINIAKKANIRPVDICDMKPLDTGYVQTSSEPRKLDENIVWEHNHIAVTVKDGHMILEVFRISDGHQKRWFHIDCTVQPKNGWEALIDNVVELYMLRHICFIIVQGPTRWPWSLVEKGRENRLEMRRVQLGCYYTSSASINCS